MANLIETTSPDDVAATVDRVAQRSRVPVLAIAAHIPRSEIGTGYFQETDPQELFRECSGYAEPVSVPEQLPLVLRIAMRTAVEGRGVAVVVVPGEIFLAEAPPAARGRGPRGGRGQPARAGGGVTGAAAWSGGPG